MCPLGYQIWGLVDARLYLTAAHTAVGLGGSMLGRLGAAALVVAAFATLHGTVRADEATLATPLSTNATILETSSRVRFGWTELAFRGNRPKAWDESFSPELRASLRVLAGIFEAKLEIGALADRYSRLGFIDADASRIELQIGINSGTWSCLAEWKPRDVFTPGFDDFLTELDTYDLRLRKRFSADLFEGLPSGLFQASLAAGYVAATPHLFARNFAELELEIVQRLSSGFVFTVAPKLELADYINFAGNDREDAIVSLRLIPAYIFSDGVTLSLEGQASIAVSTLDTKTGETWSLTPILRLQKAL